MNNYDGSFHYIPVDDNTLTLGLYVTGAGRGVIHPGQAYPPVIHPNLYQFEWQRGRTLPEFQMILITDGSGVFESKPTGETAIEPGSLMWLFPDVWHRYRPNKEVGWTEHWISFNGEMAHRLTDMKMIRPELAVQPVQAPRKLEREFKQLLDRIQEGPELHSILLSMHAMALMASALEMAWSQTPNRLVRPPQSDTTTDPMARDAVELIWTYSHRPLSVGHIAETLGVNRRTLLSGDFLKPKAIPFMRKLTPAG